MITGQAVGRSETVSLSTWTLIHLLTHVAQSWLRLQSQAISIFVFIGLIIDQWFFNHSGNCIRIIDRRASALLRHQTKGSTFFHSEFPRPYLGFRRKGGRGALTGYPELPVFSRAIEILPHGSAKRRSSSRLCMHNKQSPFPCSRITTQWARAFGKVWNISSHPIPLLFLHSPF